MPFPIIALIFIVFQLHGRYLNATMAVCIGSNDVASWKFTFSARLTWRNEIFLRCSSGEVSTHHYGYPLGPDQQTIDDTKSRLLKNADVQRYLAGKRWRMLSFDFLESGVKRQSRSRPAVIAPRFSVTPATGRLSRPVSQTLSSR
jgi:hypothetical protein